jgi:ElaB/YqjD/DUF883 family membrane-anchored ribosome-binding protein
VAPALGVRIRTALIQVGDLLMNTANNGTGPSVKEIKETVNEKVDQLKTRVIDVKDEAIERGNALVDRATDYIKANPFKAVGIAFGAGYLGMRLFRR